jgi:hypothetical protein
MAAVGEIECSLPTHCRHSVPLDASGRSQSTTVARSCTTADRSPADEGRRRFDERTRVPELNAYDLPSGSEPDRLDDGRELAEPRAVRLVKALRASLPIEISEARSSFGQ